MTGIKKKISYSAWFIESTNAVLTVFLLSVLVELLFNRIILYVYKPSHILADLSYKFKLLSPFASFSVYFSIIISSLLLFYFSVHILKIPWTSKFSRFFAGITFYFAYPLLALTCLLIPSGHVNLNLWYYISILILSSLIALSIWLFRITHIKIKNFLFWFLLVLPSVFLLLAKLISPEGNIGNAGNTSLFGHLYKIGNYLYMYQPLIWLFFMPSKVIKLTYKKVLISVTSVLVLALFFYFKTSSVVNLWYAVFHITFPLEPFFTFLYYLSLLSIVYLLVGIAEQKSIWKFTFFTGILSWFLLGYSPTLETSVMPLLFVFTVLAVFFVFIDITPKIKSLSVEELKKLWKPSKIIKESKHELFFVSKLKNEIPVKIEAEIKRGKVRQIIFKTGDIPEHEVDWTATVLPLVPIIRNLFPSMLKINLKTGKKSDLNISIWDRNFFSDTLIDAEIVNLLDKILTGEINMWWKSGIEAEFIYYPPNPEFTEDVKKLLEILIEKSGIESN